MSNPQKSGATTGAVEGCLERLRNGDPQARRDLFEIAVRRLTLLAQQLLRQFVHNIPYGTEAEDLVNELVVRMQKSLEEDLRPVNARAFWSLVWQRMNWLLLDWAREHKRFQQLADLDPAQGSTVDPVALQRHTEFHEKIKQLPGDEQEVFGMRYYLGLSVADIATALEVAEMTVRRRWVRAKQLLHDMIPWEEPRG
jgi:RNA polymerase sigma factor (sigma-70 family)